MWSWCELSAHKSSSVFVIILCEWLCGAEIDYGILGPVICTVMSLHLIPLKMVETSSWIMDLLAFIVINRSTVATYFSIANV